MTEPLYNLKAGRDNPFDVPLAAGVTVTVRPFTSLDLNVARAAARHRLQARMEAQDELAREGDLSEDALDLTDPAVREGYVETVTAEELAVRHVIAWEGVGMGLEDDVKPALPTPDNIRALMSKPLFSQTFHLKVIARQEILDAAKNAFRPAPGGGLGVGPNTAEGAPSVKTPVPTDGGAGVDGGAPSQKANRKPPPKSPSGGPS